MYWINMEVYSSNTVPLFKISILVYVYVGDTV